MITIGSPAWNKKTELGKMIYKGRSKETRELLSENSHRVVLGKGIVPGNYNHGDLGHVIGDIAIVYNGDERICTIPYKSSDWGEDN